MIAPTLMLWLCAISFGIASVFDPSGEGMPKRAEFFSTIAVSLVIASWVLADARKRGRRLCYDFDSFVYFAWPIVVPVYLFQTRGLRAFVTMLCFAGIWLVSAIVATAVFFLRDLLMP